MLLFELFTKFMTCQHNIEHWIWTLILAENVILYFFKQKRKWMPCTCTTTKSWEQCQRATKREHRMSTAREGSHLAPEIERPRDPPGQLHTSTHTASVFDGRNTTRSNPRHSQNLKKKKKKKKKKENRHKKMRPLYWYRTDDSLYQEHS